MLFDSFLNVLTSASSLILRQIFDEIILPNFFQPELDNELKIFLFKFSLFTS